MELQGLNDFIVWRYDSNGKVISDASNGGLVADGQIGQVLDPTSNKVFPGLYKIDLASSKGATQANITGLAPSVNRVYGSNSMAEVNTGTEQPSVALAANDIPYQISDLLIGLEKEKNGGYSRKGQPKQSLGGVIVHSYNTWKQIDFYFAFPMGVFIPGELNMQTNTENPTVVHDALTLNAQARGTDMLMYAKFYSTETDFDYSKMITYITGQQPVDSTVSGGSHS